jgi:hypothetical protein
LHKHGSRIAYALGIYYIHKKQYIKAAATCTQGDITALDSMSDQRIAVMAKYRSKTDANLSNITFYSSEFMKDITLFPNYLSELNGSYIVRSLQSDWG